MKKPTNYKRAWNGGNDFRNVPVTLNGKPALICGFKDKFATVKAINSAEQAEFSWDAVMRIVASGSNFSA